MNTIWILILLIWFVAGLIVAYKASWERDQQTFERDLENNGLNWCRSVYDIEDLKGALERYKKRVKRLNRFKQQYDMLTDLLQLNADEGLTDWEEQFIESLLDCEGDLPDKEFKVLETIWDRYYTGENIHEDSRKNEKDPIQSWPIPSGHDPNEGKCGWHFTQGYKEHIKRCRDVDERK